MKRILYLCLYLILPCALIAQTTTGEIRVTVKDKDTKEPVEFALVAVKQDGKVIANDYTDESGKFTFRRLNIGKYNVFVQFVGYTPQEITDVEVLQERHTAVSIMLAPTIETTTETEVVGYIPLPPIKPEVHDIGENPNRNNFNTLINQAPRTFSLDGGGLSINGTRQNANRVLWNGVWLTNSNISGFPANAANIAVTLSGFSAEYGDFLGGAINITTPRPTLATIRKVEVISSSLFDKYHNNYAEAFFMGPLLVKNRRREGDTAKVKLGYMLSANFQYQADGTPPAGGVWRVKPEKLKELEADPIRSSPKGLGFVPAAEFITKNDLEHITANQNVPLTRTSAIGELNFTPNSNIQVLLGAKYDYGNAYNYNYTNSLFNVANNSQTISHNLLTYINLTHTLRVKEGGVLKDAYYNLRLDYQLDKSTTQDPEHGDDFFSYGHIGKFTTYSTPAYELRTGGENGNPDTVWANGQKYYLKNYYRQTGDRLIDTMVTFDRSNTHNPLRANYTDAYYRLLGQDNINSITQIRSSSAGLVNGQNPIGVYSNMWNNVGLGVQGYGKSQSEQIGINASGQLSTKIHEVRFGVYFEQRLQRSWNIANANGLWTLMWQLANNGLALDTDNPLLVTDANGVFNDTVRYGFKQTASQSTFDARLRQKLIADGAVDAHGNPITQTSVIDVNSFDPSTFKLNMFSADELLNNGNNYVSYFGYDYLGNTQRGSSSISNFISDKQNRNVGAYMPTYAAAFVQDKMIFGDVTVRAGLRVERFDNNQPVLKDPFLLYDAKTVGEVKEIDGKTVEHPNSIGSNYTVYVDDARNPSKVTGYRNGTTWYSAQGLQIADPAVIAEKSKGSTIQPYLVNAAQTSVNASAFGDYKPQIMVLPRLYFEFPINQMARFYASYDVLAQRPSNNFATIAQYYYLPFNPTDIIGNPDLKPQQSFNYELGFQQRLSAKSALSLSAAYIEQRNLIQLYKYNYAYPVSYTSFANIDFSTVKSFTAQYTYEATKRINLEVSYTLQFADGTGSSAGSQQALVSSGQPNLRTLFPLSFDVRNNLKLNATYYTQSGDDYKGPTIKGKQIFANMGIVVNLNAFSGLPYTPNQQPTANTQSGVATRSPIKGTPFGARLPWQLQNDISIFKEITVKFGRDREGHHKMGMLRFSLWGNNFFNIKNIRAIHPYTGSASTDGWLASTQGQKAAQEAVSQQSFVDLYNTALANPGFYTMPRRIRLGVSLTF